MKHLFLFVFCFCCSSAALMGQQAGWGNWKIWGDQGNVCESRHSVGL